MNCPTCNKMTDDGVKFCPVCGTKLIKDVPLTVTREKKLLGFAINFDVFVDDNLIGRLKNGQSLTCEVSLGVHNIKFKCVEKDVIQQVTVTDTTQSIEVISHAKMGFIAAVAKVDDVIYK